MELKGFGTVTNELREFQANKQVMVVPLIKMFDGGHRWIFTDLGDGSTRIDHELEMRPKGVFKLIGPLLRTNGEKTSGKRLPPCSDISKTPPDDGLRQPGPANHVLTDITAHTAKS